MHDKDLFQAALGIGAPWQVIQSLFDPAAQRLDIYLSFPKGSRFSCRICGAQNCPAYDSSEKTWRHLNFFQHEAYLHARVRGSSAPFAGSRLCRFRGRGMIAASRCCSKRC